MDSAGETAIDEFSPTTASELSRWMADNARDDRRPLMPVGGRTALQYGGPVLRDAVAVATSRLNRVVDYPARDMTITVEAGIRVEDLQKLLANERQRLAVDVPQAHRATLGGAIAANTSGPGRFGAGTFRDYVIGISAVDGQGRLFSAGGRVVKNVAGYDLCKLLIGSLGTLACISQVTLKLRPAPERRTMVWATFPDLLVIDGALERLLKSETRPAAIEVLNPKAAWQLKSDSPPSLPAERPVLCLAFEGSEREAVWQAERARDELRDASAAEIVILADDDADSLYGALVEYEAASDDPLTFTATLPPSRVAEFLAVANESEIALQAHAGNGVVIGHLPDRFADPRAAATLLDPLRLHAERHGGALVILSCDPEWRRELPVFGASRRDAVLMKGIKAALDPHNLLSPGRMGW